MTNSGPSTLDCSQSHGQADHACGAGDRGGRRGLRRVFHLGRTPGGSRTRWRAFHWSAAALACALALGQLRASASSAGSTTCACSACRCRPPTARMVFLAGFALTVTPGKLGEAVKAFLLRESHRIPMARTAPIVIAERMTDLIALLLLAMVGVFTFDVDRRFLVAGGLLVALAIAVVSIEPMAEAGAVDRRPPAVRAAVRAAAARVPRPHRGAVAPRATRRRDRAVVRVVVPRVPGVLDRRGRYGGRRGRPSRRYLHLCVDDGGGRAVVSARAGSASPRRACSRC